jgi:hypothetical protein
VNVLGSLAQLGGHRGALVVAHIRHYDAGTFRHEAAGGSGAGSTRSGSVLTSVSKRRGRREAAIEMRESGRP